MIIFNSISDKAVELTKGAFIGYLAVAFFFGMAVACVLTGTLLLGFLCSLMVGLIGYQLWHERKELDEEEEEGSSGFKL